MTAGPEEEACTTAFVDLGGRYTRARARSSEFCRSIGLPRSSGAVGAVLASPIRSAHPARRSRARCSCEKLEARKTLCLGRKLRTVAISLLRMHGHARASPLVSRPLQRQDAPSGWRALLLRPRGSAAPGTVLQGMGIGAAGGEEEWRAGCVRGRAPRGPPLRGIGACELGELSLRRRGRLRLGRAQLQLSLERVGARLRRFGHTHLA